MAEPAFVGRRSIVGSLQATGGVFHTAAAARGPLGVPSGSEVVTGRAGCLNGARPDLWEGRRVSAAPTRRSYFYEEYELTPFSRDATPRDREEASSAHPLTANIGAG